MCIDKVGDPEFAEEMVKLRRDNLVILGILEMDTFLRMREGLVIPRMGEVFVFCGNVGRGCESGKCCVPGNGKVSVIRRMMKGVMIWDRYFDSENQGIAYHPEMRVNFVIIVKGKILVILGIEEGSVILGMRKRLMILGMKTRLISKCN